MRVAGNSIILFGVISIAMSLVMTILTRSVYVDLTAIAPIAIGWLIRGGNHRAVKWGIGCMGYFIVVLLTLAVLIVCGSSLPKIGPRPVTRSDAAWLILSMSLFAAWPLANLFMCWRIVRHDRRVARNQCPACGYPAGASDLCTECGKPAKVGSFTRGPT
jgi:hypothetical protein